MPISIDEFESSEVASEPSVSERVVSFLAANRDHAFTRSEIAAALDTDPNAVSTALSRLESRELVRHRGDHWAIAEDLDRVRAAYDPHRVTTALNEMDGGIDAEAWDEAAPEGPHPSEESGSSADGEV